jgi:hypothetical protein
MGPNWRTSRLGLSPLGSEGRHLSIAELCVEEVIYLPSKRRAFTHCSNSYAHDFGIDVETNTWYQTLDNSQPHPASPYIGQSLTFDTLRQKVVLVNRGGSDRVEVWDRDE